MLIEKLNLRTTNLLIFLICVGLIVTALIIQEIMGMHPCPLCITQRICVIATGVVALIAAIHNPHIVGRKIYALIGIVAAAAGVGFAGRHVWLQSLPEDLAPACGPGLSYMLENFPFMQAFQLLLLGDGNCSKVDWTFLGLSIPGWLLICFSGLIVINLWQLFRKE